MDEETLARNGLGIFRTLVHRLFRLKEFDKRIEKSRDTFAALDRTLDKLPQGSAVMIRDEGVEIAIWKGGRELIDPPPVLIPMAAFEVTGPAAVPELPSLGGPSLEVG